MVKRLLITVVLLAIVLAPEYGLGAPTEDNLTSMPKGDLPGWKQVLADDFEEYGEIPVGSFSNCDKNHICEGLPGKLKERWWAYPKNWPDTAKKNNYPLGGVYNPEETVSISNGMMQVKMFNNGGDNQVAAVLPKATMGQTYGRYVIRFKAETTPGYKMAWLLWPDERENCKGCEIDFPEGQFDEEISAFMHHKQSGEGGKRQDHFTTGQKFGEWHTTVIEWSPGKVEFFLDGKKIQGKSADGKSIDASTTNVPDQPMNWVIQSESALDDRAKSNEVVAKNGSSATILIDWVAAYKYTGGEQEQNTEQDQNTEEEQEQDTEQVQNTEGEQEQNTEQNQNSEIWDVVLSFFPIEKAQEQDTEQDQNTDGRVIYR